MQFGGASRAEAPPECCPGREVQDSLLALQVESEVVRLYEEHGQGVFRYAFAFTRNHEQAQDAVQEAFLRYFLHRGGGQCINNPKAWLLSVVRNYLLDRLRESGTREEEPVEDQYPDWRENPEIRYQWTETTRDISNSLAPRELECVRLRAQGLAYDEIACALGISAGTVGALLTRANKKVRSVLQR